VAVGREAAPVGRRRRFGHPGLQLALTRGSGQDLADGTATPAAAAPAPAQDSVGSETLAQLATIEITDTVRPLTPEQSAAISQNPPAQVETGRCANARRYTALKAKST
jgi:hypothetical protein